MYVTKREWPPEVARFRERGRFPIKKRAEDVHRYHGTLFQAKLGWKKIHMLNNYTVSNFEKKSLPEMDDTVHGVFAEDVESEPLINRVHALLPSVYRVCIIVLIVCLAVTANDGKLQFDYTHAETSRHACRFATAELRCERCLHRRDPEDCTSLIVEDEENI